MKKLMTILVLAGVLSVPSVVFAEASWYASLRAGVESSGGNLAVKDGASRWGIKGSAEAGEGLTAVYRFEHKITTPNAAQPGGRLSYVGLSGGFGTVTVGQIWNAAYNSTGAITDNAWYYGDAQTGYRHGNAVSYAFSNDLMALQLDAIYGEGDGEDNPNDDLEKIEFGLSVNIADMGKVAVSHTDNKFSEDRTQGSSNTMQDDGDTSWRTKTATVAAQVSVSGLTVYAGAQTASYTCTGVFAGAGSDAAGYTGACEPSTAAHVKAKAKTTFFGFSGDLGDTGTSYLFQWRDVKSMNKKPWVLSLTRGLGDSASLILEHGNNDGGDNQTQLGLAVSF